MAVAHHAGGNRRGRWRRNLLRHALVGLALAVALAVRNADVVVLVDVRAFGRAGRGVLIDVGVDCRRGALVHVRVDVCRHALAGRDVRVQVCVVRRAGRHAIAEIAVRVEVRRRGRTLVQVAIGVQVGAVDRAGIGAVHRLIDGAGRNVGVEVVVGRCGRVLIDVRSRTGLHIVVRVGRCRRAGRRIDVIVVVRRRAGGRVYVRVRIGAGRSAVGGCVVDIVCGLGQHEARPAYRHESEVPFVDHVIYPED